MNIIKKFRSFFNAGGTVPGVVVDFDENNIWCQKHGLDIETMPWSELKGIAIWTTDQGPFVDDVFWVLGSKDRTIFFPSDAAGSEEFLMHIQKFKNFDNEAVINAMCCTGNNIFICWEKKNAQ